jgi:3-oxoadipate enol-lactonase
MPAIVDGVVARWYTKHSGLRAGAIEATRQMLLTTPAKGHAASCAAVRDMDQRESISQSRRPWSSPVRTTR